MALRLDSTSRVAGSVGPKWVEDGGWVVFVMLYGMRLLELGYTIWLRYQVTSRCENQTVALIESV